MFFSNEFLKQIIKDTEEKSRLKCKECWCSTRDVLQARVDGYAMETENYLGAAVIGEIGNNTFDHNWDFAEGYSRGTYLRFERQRSMVILADFGRGIRQSLKAVFYAENDEKAVNVAFTQRLSGRAPEQRGNGLKFVLESVARKKWSMYYQSGNGCCIVDRGNVIFTSSGLNVIGCLAILTFGGGSDEA